MRLIVISVFLLVLLHCSYAPPVTQDKDKEKDSEVKDDLEEYMEYHRYLKEVVQALESDPEFRERLEKAEEDDVRTGKIAEHLDFVNHNVRTKLDEIKRRELERLRQLATKQFELTNNLEIDTNKIPSNEHLDHSNPHTFEIEDLKKLIKKTSADLEAADKQRKEEFKEYEMQKEYQKHQKLEEMDDTQKKEFIEKEKKEEDAKKHHKPLHHPVTREQLLALWKAGNLDEKDFDPKAFFMMHDVDGNGVWDADEVKALFIKELDKLYGPNGPNKDRHERAEEMERMREHVFKENDRNQDGLIDFNEFIMETQKADFNQDEGWKSIDENQIYTQDEYHDYERKRQEEFNFLRERGLIDEHGRPVPGAEHQLHAAYQQLQAMRQQQAYQQMQQHPGQYPPQGHQQQYQQHPQQGYQGQYPPVQAAPGHYQANQQHPNQNQYMGQGQVPQGQYPGQLQGQYPPQPQQGYPVHQQPQQGYQAQPQQGYQAQAQQGYQGQQPQGQVPQGQVPQGQVPQGQVPQGQVPSNQLLPGQVPQNQGPSGQVPQGQAPQGQAGQTPGQQQGQPPVINAIPVNQGQGQPTNNPSSAGQPAPNQAPNPVPPANAVH